MAAETVRDVVINIKLAQLDAALKAPSTKALMESLGGYKKAAVETSKAVVDSFDKSGDAIVDNVSEIEKLNRKMEEAKQKASAAAATMVDTSLRAGEGFKAAGEGAFTLARGIAFMSTSSDEDLQKVVARIAQVQGAFDLFKGTTETLKGVIEGARAMRVVLTGVSVANVSVAATNTTVATTNTAVAVTGAAAATSMSALAIALGPLAIGLAAVAVAFFFFKDAEEDVEEVGNAADVAAQKMERLARFTGEVASVQERRGIQRGELRAITLLETELTLSQKLLSNEELRFHSARDLATAFTLITGARPTFERIAEREGITVDEAIRNRIERSVQAGRGQRTEEQVQKQIDLRQIVLTDQKTLLTLERDDLKLIEQQGDALRRNADMRRRELETVKELAEKEQQRLRTLDETFGRLDPAKQLALRGLATRVQAGETLTRAELGTLEGLGGAGVKGFVSEEFRERGAAAGAAAVFQQFDQRPLRGPGSIERELRTKQTNIETQLTELVGQAERLAEDRQDQVERLGDVLERTFATTNALKALEFRLIELQQNINRSPGL